MPIPGSPVMKTTCLSPVSIRCVMPSRVSSGRSASNPPLDRYVLSGRRQPIDDTRVLGECRLRHVRSFVEPHSIDAYWPRDVLELVLTGVLKGDAEPVETGVHVFLHAVRHADTANFRQCLQARCHVHPVTMDAGVLDDVADVDPHSELEPLLWRHLCISVGHRALDLDRATHRVHDACKQDEQPVASRPCHPATVFLDLGLNELAVMGIQLSEGALVVSPYQAAVAGYIRHQNGHKPALDLLTTHSFPAKGGRQRCALIGLRRP